MRRLSLVEISLSSEILDTDEFASLFFASARGYHYWIEVVAAEVVASKHIVEASGRLGG